MTRRRLIDPETYVATTEGNDIAMGWRRIVAEFVAGIPEGVDLSDVAYLCGFGVQTEISRRIVIARRGLAHANALAEYRRAASDHDPNWLKRIEALKAGDECESRGAAETTWHRCIVEHNGGPGFWRVRRVDNGERWDPYIEHVRCVGQTEAWPR